MQQSPLIHGKYTPNQALEQILSLLQGHELDPTDTGMIGQINDVDQRLKKIEAENNKWKWIISGWRGVAIFIGGTISTTFTIVYGIMQIVPYLKKL